MSLKLIAVAAAVSLLVVGCAQNPVDKRSVAPERTDSEFLKVKNAQADELYINPSSGEGGVDFRRIYIEPLNISKMQIIQPEGAARDDRWKVDDLEDAALQNAMASEFSRALSFESAYNVVATRAEAQMSIFTTIVAIHPNATLAEVTAGARSGGAITVSVALVNTATDKVMVRTVDTKSTDNIWAFHQVDNKDEAIDLIFRAWGNSMRRGLLHLQGRSSDPLAEPLILKEK